MNKLINTMFLGFVALSVSLPASAANIIYTSQKAGYTITFPKSWQIKPTTGLVDLLAISPPDSKGDTYNENISVVVEPTKIVNTSAAYFKDNKMVMAKSIQGFKIVKEGMDIVGRKPAYWMIFNQTTNGVKLQLKSYFFYKDGNGYVITCASTPSSFNRYLLVFNQIATSMKF